MEEKYRFLFFRFIYEVLNLRKIEKELEQNGVKYIENPNLFFEEENTCYKYSKYFYLLNNIDLSRLTDGEKKFLESFEDIDLNEEIVLFLEETYKRVIYNNFANQEDDYWRGCVTNEEAILLGIRYDEHSLANNFVDDVIKRIEQGAKGPKIRIIKYNELHKKENNEGIEASRTIL